MDAHFAPSSYAPNRPAWVHVFPEGMVHQHRDADMRYFKWGAARLILEAEPPPDVVPMFIDGTQRVMSEDRGFPRFLPRVGARVRVAFGAPLDYDAVFGDLRRRWRGLVDADGGDRLPLGKVADHLKEGPEAREIRAEVVRRLREEVLKVRKTLGYPEADPAFGLPETWAGDFEKTKRAQAKSIGKSPVDDSGANHF
jgi:monolysocardiolipin acyltransferase